MAARAMTGLLFLALLTPVFGGGCFACASTVVPATLTLDTGSEEVRTLPILTSRAVSIAGVAVPDSHGLTEVRVGLQSPNITEVEADNLHVALLVAGRSVPIRLLKVEGGGFRQTGGDFWTGGKLQNGTVLRFWWTVDRDRSRVPSTWVLDEGASYSFTIDFTWRFDDCAVRASGHMTKAVTGHVRASVNAQNFENVGTPTFEKTAAGAGFRARYSVSSGLETELDSVTAKAVFLGTATAATVALVLFTKVGHTVDGTAGDVVGPDSDLRVFSSATTKGIVYASTGTVAPATMDVREGLVVLLVDLDYHTTDGTPGSRKDTFAYGLAV